MRSEGSLGFEWDTKRATAARITRASEQNTKTNYIKRTRQPQREGSEHHRIVCKRVC